VVDIARQLKVQDLNARYAEAIDDDRLAVWPDFFTDDGRYRITTAENIAQDLPLSMMYATSRAMLRDRVKALRQANVYEAQHYRHILGAPRIAEADGVLSARTPLIVVRIMHTGEMTIFATGCYQDRVVFEGSHGEPRFAEKTVILDSRVVDTLLAIPL
jgi:3-phenylpropionate/cinnamic acid dioxygenase small subunit